MNIPIPANVASDFLKGTIVKLSVFRISSAILFCILFLLPLVCCAQPPQWSKDSNLALLEEGVLLDRIVEVNHILSPGSRVTTSYNSVLMDQFIDCTICPHCVSRNLNITSIVNVTNYWTSDISSYDSNEESCRGCKCKREKFLLCLTHPEGGEFRNISIRDISPHVEEDECRFRGYQKPDLTTLHPQLKRQLININYSQFVNISYINNEISIHTIDPLSTFAIAVIRSTSFLISCTQPICIKEVPTELLISDGILHVSVYLDDNLAAVADFPIIKSDTCTIVDCVFLCKEYFTHFICYSTATQAFISISFIVSLIVIVSTISFLIYKLIVLCYPTIMMNFNMIVKAKNKEEENLPETSEELEVLDSDPSPVNTPKEVKIMIPRAGSRKPKLLDGSFTIFIIILLTINANAECIGTTTLISQITECLHTSENILSQCSINLNTQVVLPNIGAASCISFFDTKTNTPLGEIKVSLDSVKIKGHLSHQYFTSDWSILTSSSKYCSGTTTYCGSSACELTSSDDDSMLTGEATLYPGVVQCRSSCGCAGCGCISCADACLYSKYSFKPHGGAYRVLQIVGFSVIPILNISVTVAGQTSYLQNEFVGDELEFGNFTFTNIGAISYPPIHFGDKGLVMNNTHAYIEEFCKLGDPCFGLPGDLQTEYHNWVEGPQYYFSFPHELIPSLEQPNSISFDAPESGISIMRRLSSKFPFSQSEIFWTTNGVGLIGFDSNPPPIIFYINTPSDIEFKILVTKVCPILLNVKTNGCYSCNNGFSFVLSSKSSCDSGSVRISINTKNRITLFQNSVVITETEKNFTIPAQSMDRLISGEITLSWGSINSTLQFNGALSEPPLIQQHMINFTHSHFDTVPVDEQLISDWWNSLPSSLDGLKYTILIILIIVAIAITCLIFYCLYLLFVYLNNKYSPI